jgi:signal transduction histidine kinase
LNTEYIDPRALLAEIRETLLPEAEKRKIKLDALWSDDVPMIQADPVRLRQVITNLASNALKFTPNRGQVQITARLAELHLADNDNSDDEPDDGMGAALMMAPERAVEIAVNDNGIGMEQTELPKIFDAFYQVDGSSTREYGGAGLGLSIAKSLVEAHHGQIRVESELGQGTTFYILLPENQPDSAAG